MLSPFLFAACISLVCGGALRQSSGTAVVGNSGVQTFGAQNTGGAVGGSRTGTANTFGTGRSLGTAGTSGTSAGVSYSPTGGTAPGFNDVQVGSSLFDNSLRRNNVIGASDNVFPRSNFQGSGNNALGAAGTSTGIDFGEYGQGVASDISNSVAGNTVNRGLDKTIDKTVDRNLVASGNAFNTGLTRDNILGNTLSGGFNTGVNVGNLGGTNVFQGTGTDSFRSSGTLTGTDKLNTLPVDGTAFDTSRPSSLPAASNLGNVLNTNTGVFPAAQNTLGTKDVLTGNRNVIPRTETFSNSNAFPSTNVNVNQNLFPTQPSDGSLYQTNNANAFPNTINTGGSQTQFSATTGDLFRNTNTNAFPGTLNNVGTSNTVLPSTIGSTSGTASFSAGPTSSSKGVNTNNAFSNTFNNNLLPPATNTINDGRFPNSLNNNQNTFASASNVGGLPSSNTLPTLPNAVPSTLPNKVNTGSASSFPGSPGGALPSTLNTKTNTGGFVSSSRSSFPATSITTGNVANNVFDSGVNTKTGTVSLTGGQLDQLSGRSGLGDALNINSFLDDDGTFPTENSALRNPFDTNNVLGTQTALNTRGDVLGGSGLVDNNRRIFGSRDPSDITDLGQESSSIDKELDARTATAGFSGFSDGRDGVFSNAGVLSNNRGLQNLAGSAPSLPASSRLNVGSGQSLGGRLGASAGLGGRGTVGSAGSFGTSGNLINNKAAGAFTSPQNALNGNSLTNRFSSNLNTNPLARDQFANTGLNSATGGGLNNNIINAAKTSVTQPGTFGNPQFPGSAAGSLSGNVVNNQGIAANNVRSFGQQPLGIGSQNNVFRNNVGVGSTFTNQPVKSGVGNFGNFADNALSSVQSTSNQGFRNAGLGNVLNPDPLARTDFNNVGIRQGFSSGANTLNSNLGKGDLASGSGFAVNFPQSSSTTGLGTDFGTNVGRSSSKSGFSSSSSGNKGSTFGGRGSLSSGTQSGSGLGVGNSLTGLAFGSRGLDGLSGTQTAVTGSNKRVFDTGLLGTSSNQSSGGRNSFTTGSGSAVSRSTGTSYNNNDFSDSATSGSTGSRSNSNSISDNSYANTGRVTG